MEKSKENQPSSSSMEVCEVNDDDKFKVRFFKVFFLGIEACVCETCIYLNKNSSSSYSNSCFA